MLSRRDFLKLFGLGALGTFALGSYAFAIEPLFRLRKKRYQFTPPGWTADLSLKVCVLADFHFCKPWMTVGRLRSIIDQAHALEPDIILLLGDFAAGMRT
ncbi:MAG: metallophosphoesterase, partial [Nitratireductor sp.]|nr:metallophosphoesterase [Nitratireductor sp.]